MEIRSTMWQSATFVWLTVVVGSCTGYRAQYEADIDSLVKKTSSNPAVESTQPADGATAVSVTTSIVITFNEAIDASTVTTNTTDNNCSGSLQVSSDNFSSCASMQSAPASDNTGKVFTVQATGLAYETSYQVKLTTGIQSAVGAALSSEHVFSFTTGAEPGGLDASFHGDGVVTFDIKTNSEDRINDFALDSSGRIVLTGTSGSSPEEMFVIRLQSNGLIDSSFGTNGISIHQGGSGAGNGIGIDASGNIFVTGEADGSSNPDSAIWRYNDDGTLHNTFGGNCTYGVGAGGAFGCALHNNAAGGNSSDQATRMTIDGSGKILVTGESNNGGDDDMIIWRYNTDGTLDATFGDGTCNNGVGASNDMGCVIHNNAAGGNQADIGNAIIIDSGGKIIVAGNSAQSACCPTNHDMAIWRYNANGTLDTTFNGTGFVTHDNAANGNGADYGHDLAIDSAGRILVAGRSRNGSSNDDMVIWRHNSDGTIDSTFGDGSCNNGVGTGGNFGCVVHDNAAGASGGDRASAIAIDASGNIIVVGRSDGASSSDMAIWRYTSNGVLDTTFDNDGYFTHNDAAGGDSSDYATDVKIDPLGKMIVGGYSYSGTSNDVAVWRLKP